MTRSKALLLVGVPLAAALGFGIAYLQSHPSRLGGAVDDGVRERERENRDRVHNARHVAGATSSTGTEPESFRPDSPKRTVLEWMKEKRLTLLEGYNEDERDPSWAPGMEATMRSRFDKTDFAAAGLAGMSVDAVECRSSTCRLEFTYPGSLKAAIERRATEDGLSPDVGPIDYLAIETGPLAPASILGSVEQYKDARGLDYERVTGVVGFRQNTLDPAKYGQWLAERKDFGSEAKRRFRERLRQRAEEKQSRSESQGAR